MRVGKIILTALLLGVFGLLAFGCDGSDETDAPKNQEVKVERGNLVIDITAAGNLALARTEELAFEVAGTVAEVLVEEGDPVEEGQVLARLDTKEWEDHLKALRDKLRTAERQLTAKERALVTAKRMVNGEEDDAIEAERQVSVKGLSVREAQLNLDKAEYNLSQISDVRDAQDAVDEAEWALEFAESMLAGEAGGGLVLVDYAYWVDLKDNAEDELERAQDYLEELLSGRRITISSDVALEVTDKQLQFEKKQVELEDARLNVEAAKKALEDARLDVEDAQQDVEDAQQDVEDAQQDVEDAQGDLDEALSTSLEIIAPFDSFVTKVNVEGGDEVLKGTVAVKLADPDKFEADILVGETDIFQVVLGGEAWVQVDAMSGISLPAEVAHISPTATIQSGVVNYQVTVAIKSFEAMMQERREARQPAVPETSSGELPERIRQAIEEGSITQEQVEEMMRRRQEGEVPSWPQGQTPEGSPSAPGAGVTLATQPNFQLREGLTVTVSIIVAERNDVLLVPNQAITRKGGQTLVQVVKDGVSETRPIEVGISDYQFTEVTEGLSEGDTVVVTGTTSTTAATSSPSQQSQRMFVPGMGRIR